MTFDELQPEVDALLAQVTENTSTEGSAVALLNGLGGFFQQHKDDPAKIEALAVGLTNAKGDLKLSADALAAAIVANTPAAPPA